MKLSTTQPLIDAAMASAPTNNADRTKSSKHPLTESIMSDPLENAPENAVPAAAAEGKKKRKKRNKKKNKNKTEEQTRQEDTSTGYQLNPLHPLGGSGIPSFLMTKDEIFDQVRRELDAILSPKPKAREGEEKKVDGKKKLLKKKPGEKTKLDENKVTAPMIEKHSPH